MSEASVDDRAERARTLASEGGAARGSSYAALADAGWLALSRETVFGWEARFSQGVTKRANSAWPKAGAGEAAVSADAFSAVEAAYRRRGLNPCFQLSSADEAVGRLLIGRGYRAVDETLVLAASVPASFSVSPAVDVSREPSGDWLACWWAVDGRGGTAELDVARQILTGTPSLYGAVRVGGQVVSVARLALVGEWAGLYCVVTAAEHRRRGHSTAVIESLLAVAAREYGVTDAWLQVLAGNTGAIALYSQRFGFREAGRYRYLVGPARVPAAPACR